MENDTTVFVGLDVHKESVVAAYAVGSGEIQSLCGTQPVNMGLPDFAGWLDQSARNPTPRKAEQDGVDALLCLLVGLHFAAGGKMLVVGDMNSGYGLGASSWVRA